MLELLDEETKRVLLRGAFGISLYHYILALSIVAVGSLIAWLARRITGSIRRRLSGRVGTFGDLALSTAYGPVFWVIFFSGFLLGLDVLRLPIWLEKLRHNVGT